VDELVSASLIDNTEFIEQFLKKYPAKKPLLLHLPSGRSYRPPFPVSAESSFDIFARVRVALTGETQMYLDLSGVGG
jgi:hypothetical protein